MNDEHLTWERLLDLAVYAPIGVAVTLRDDLPRYARQGRQALENRVTLARFIGKFAVQQGQRELARRVEARRQLAEYPSEPPDDTTVSPPTVVVPVAIESPTATPAEAPPSSSLPIAEYESLAASQVVQRLGSLRPDELEAIRSFEVAHRARRTVLGKISQLQGG